MPTTPEDEAEFQNCWRRRCSSDQIRPFDALLASEFHTKEERQAYLDRAIANLTRYCARQVPYYTRLFDHLGLTPDQVADVDGLRRLPPLTRDVVQHEGEQLYAKPLPPGERLAGDTRTSGSTGVPVIVRQTARVAIWFTLLKQREYRWFRYDPAGTFVSIRVDGELPRLHGRMIRVNEAGKFPRWPTVGHIFETGPSYAMNFDTTIDIQAEFMERVRPDYLLSPSSNLEYLAATIRDRRNALPLHGMLSVSQQLTPAMRQVIETVFQSRLDQNYGFNEIGIVASRCPEGGRYHVHTEHCLVEIVDPDGSPTPPGKFGRLLVTGLNNAAMPLLRYDPDDLAQVPEGPCPCGRTLPSFTDLWGRYRRMSCLPVGTYQRWMAVFHVLSEPDGNELIRGIRQFQLVQYRDGRFDLRLCVSEPLTPRFHEVLQHHWSKIEPGPPPPLTVVIVDRIARGPSGKLVDFVSEFMPPADGTAPNIPEFLQPRTPIPQSGGE